MYSFNQRPLGVISCPGSDIFATKVVARLDSLAQVRFNQKIQALVKNYNLTTDQAITQYHLSNDMASSQLHPNEVVSQYRKPVFKIETKFTRFANGEIKAEILESIRERDIYIIQDVYSMQCGSYFGTDADDYSVNDHFMTLLTAVDAVIASGPARITCVLPAYPYARQHKKKGREGLTAALVGRILEEMGVDYILTLDIHSKDIEHTFRHLHLDSLHANYQILRQLAQIIDLNTEDLVVVSPDTGAVDRNKYYANILNKPLAMLYKERDYSKVSINSTDSNITNVRLLGEVAGKTVLLTDDMLGTGGTLIKAMQMLKEHGAGRVIIGISLPLFTGEAIDRLEQAYNDGLFYRMIGCSAITLPESYTNRPWYVVADVSNLFALAISRINSSQSLSNLIDNNDIIQELLNK